MFSNRRLHYELQGSIVGSAMRNRKLYMYGAGKRSGSDPRMTQPVIEPLVVSNSDGRTGGRLLAERPGRWELHRRKPGTHTEIRHS